MIVLKLPEGIYEYPEIAYYDRQTGKLCSTKFISRLRNDQIIQHCIRTLSREKHCRVMVVGTHRDCFDTPTDSAANINSKNHWLLRNIKSTLRDKLLVYDPPNNVLFPLNAKTPDEEDLKVANAIRKEIACDKFNSYKVPIAWFLLEQDMQKLNKSVITLKECYNLAFSLHMSKEQVNEALKYFHKLNIILFYPSILPNIVFVSPQVIVDKITELIEFSFELQGKAESEQTDTKWDRYKYFGEVSFKMLREQRFSKHYDSEVFTPKELVHIFARFFIMAAITPSETPILNRTYFMPSLLPEIVAEDLDSFRPQTPLDFLTPALLYFPDGCAPSGTFSRLSVYLVSQCGWKQEDKLYRNCIKFCLGNEPGEVTIIDAFGWYEVYLEAPGDVALNICYTILQNIISGLEAAHKALQMEKMSYELAIMCPKQGLGKCKDSPHAAIVNSTAQYWTCTENPKNYGVLVRKQSVWFSKSIPLPGVNFISQATLTILKRDELQTLEWENHGLKIHVPPGALPDSDTHCEIDVGACFSGSFKFPEKHALVSPIFYIQPSKNLKKPVTLEIEHWCSVNSEDDSKSLVPIFAQSSTKKPPYVFLPIKTKTTLNQSWGVFEVKTFSLFGLSWSSLWRQMVPHALKAPPSVLYLGRVYYSSQSQRLLRVRLVITPQITQYQKAVERAYTPDNWTFLTDFKFSFLEGNNILSVDIGHSGVTTDDGWLIRACNPPPEINRDEIHECKDSEPANCELSAKWKSSGEALQDLDYFVRIQGVNRNGFLLTISSDSVGPAAAATEAVNQRTETRTEVTEEHLSVLCSFLKKHAARWQLIGTHLRFKPGELSIIQSTLPQAIEGPEGYLREMLCHWLQWAPGDRRGSKDFATLEALEHALRESDFGKSAIQLRPAICKEFTLNFL